VIYRDLAILALVPTAVYQTRRGLMEYNLVFVRDGIRELVSVEDDSRRGLMNGEAKGREHVPVD